MLSLLYGPTLTPIHDYWKNHSFDYTDLFWQCNDSDWYILPSSCGFYKYHPSTVNTVIFQDFQDGLLGSLETLTPYNNIELYAE